MLFVANAQTQSVAVVSLGEECSRPPGDDGDGDDREGVDGGTGRVVGFVPTARYPSALAMVGAELFIGNGKGEAPARPNAPTAAFPPNAQAARRLRAVSVSAAACGA